MHRFFINAVVLIENLELNSSWAFIVATFTYTHVIPRAIMAAIFCISASNIWFAHLTVNGTIIFAGFKPVWKKRQGYYVTQHPHLAPQSLSTSSQVPNHLDHGDWLYKIVHTRL
jgi:hypothetical protein